MNKNRIFRLYACCIPVKGAIRSTICDLQRVKYYFIPNALFDILILHKDKSIEEIKVEYNHKGDQIIDEYFDFLMKEELGFWLNHQSEASSFPPIEMKWERPEPITNVIIDVNAQSNHNYELISSQLDELACKNLQIRFFSKVGLSTLQKISFSLKKSNLRFIELLIKENKLIKQGHLRKLNEQNSKIQSIVIHSTESTKYKRIETGSNLELQFINQKVESSDHCGNINPQYFASNLDVFLESQEHNTCLNRKMSIDINGKIKNCPSMKESYGNIKSISLSSALLKKDFKKYWAINKDQIEVCQLCEFRHICTDCRAFIENDKNIYSKPSKCSYNPLSGKWN